MRQLRPITRSRRCRSAVSRTKDAMVEITWAWSINLGKSQWKAPQTHWFASDEWGDNFQTEATARDLFSRRSCKCLAGSDGPRSARRCCQVDRSRTT